MTSIFFVQYVTKQLLDSVFVISRMIKVSVRASADNPYLDLDYFDITKTSSNNCLFKE